MSKVNVNVKHARVYCQQGDFPAGSKSLSERLLQEAAALGDRMGSGERDRSSKAYVEECTKLLTGLFANNGVNVDLGLERFGGFYMLNGGVSNQKDAELVVSVTKVFLDRAKLPTGGTSIVEEASWGDVATTQTLVAMETIAKQKGPEAILPYLLKLIDDHRGHRNCDESKVGLLGLDYWYQVRNMQIAYESLFGSTADEELFAELLRPPVDMWIRLLKDIKTCLKGKDMVFAIMTGTDGPEGETIFLTATAIRCQKGILFHFHRVVGTAALIEAPSAEAAIKFIWPMAHMQNLEAFFLSMKKGRNFYTYAPQF